VSDRLTISVIVGTRTDAHSFRSHVGMGSESDCLFGQLGSLLYILILLTLYCAVVLCSYYHLYFLIALFSYSACKCVLMKSNASYITMSGINTVAPVTSVECKRRQRLFRTLYKFQPYGTSRQLCYRDL